MRPERPRRPLRARQRLGKYRIRGRLGKGGFADVYEAVDTVEGARVALKIPHHHLVTKEVLRDFYREVRLASRLDHVNILGLKNAEFIDRKLVMTFALGKETLADRMKRRMSLKTALGLAEQALEAVAFAHRSRIIHCDIKPDNLILFSNDLLRLTDFGIAKVARRTIRASGSGTIGYCAPEQAMGKPSQRSDVFSLGLIFYQMLSARLPEWPFSWPPPGHDRLRRRVHADMVAVIRRSLEVEPRRRFRDANAFLAAFRRAKPKALRRSQTTRRRQHSKPTGGNHWKSIRYRQFRKRWGRELETRHACAACSGPVGESMRFCPWCGQARRVHQGRTSFPARCPRCARGVKLDWRFCPWCYGAGFAPHGTRQYTDKRYSARCSNPSCSRKQLMPFMRYCPWCRRKVRRQWPIAGHRERCGSCGWGVLKEFWHTCPWCGKSLRRS